MIKLTNNLIRLFEEEKSMIVKFEELTNGDTYSNNAAVSIEKKLKMLARAEIIKFSREDIGFNMVLLNKRELQEINEALKVISAADQETKDFLNQVAIEIKGRTKTEAIAIINYYSDKITE